MRLRWARARLYRSYQRATALRVWLERRFTRAGLVVLVGMLGTGMLSWDVEQTRSYQAFGFLISLLGVATLGAGRFRGRLSVQRHLPRFATVDRPLRYRVVIRNETTKPQAGLTVREEFTNPQLSFEDFAAITEVDDRETSSFRLIPEAPRWRFTVLHSKETRIPLLQPGEEREVNLELTAWRRGLVHLRGLRVFRPDPLGLVKSSLCLEAPQSVVVLPKRYPLPPLALPGTRQYQPGGVALASSVGESEEFMALRDYRRGDPLRHIHWRSWAKIGRPIVKEFEDEFFVRHALILDTFTPRPQSEVLEAAVAVAASFACALESQESLLDLLFVGPQAYCFTAGRGLGHTDRMLEVLASVQACRDQPLAALEHLVFDHVAALSGCVCLLMNWDQERRELVRKLRALGIPVLVLVIVARGRSKELDPGPLGDQPERLRVLEVGRIAEGLAAL